jgi:hypothetical protein
VLLCSALLCCSALLLWCSAAALLCCSALLLLCRAAALLCCAAALLCCSVPALDFKLLAFARSHTLAYACSSTPAASFSSFSSREGTAMPQPHFRQGFASMYPILRSTAHSPRVLALRVRTQLPQLSTVSTLAPLRRAAAHWSPYARAVLDFRIEN